ncbi:MAG: type IX secretion system protein PorQ, partial [Muribaculaceae bacterium]|nr:type IX secretion system protein PorQ [Muribaculaceae bacterium]
INLVEQNPALLGPEIDHQVGLNYMKYIGSTNFMGARYGQGLTEHSAIAVGLQYYGYGKFEGMDQEGISTGTFNANDINFNVTYTHDITDNLRGGITLKYLYSKYEEYTAGAITADLGVNYYNPDNELSLSLVLKNLGGQVKKFNDRTSDVPWDVQVGISKMLKSAPIRFSLTAYNLRYWHLPYYKIADKNNPNSEFVKEDKFGANLLRHLVFGIEVLPTDKIYIGLGYNHKVRTDMSTYQRNFLSGFSLGAGMRVKAFGFGVALAQPHTSATTFMVNLTTSIGELMH